MKPITRSTNIKNHLPVSELVFSNPEANEKYLGQFTQQKYTPDHQQQRQERSHLYIMKQRINSQLPRQQCLNDRSITTRLQSNHIYDSVRNSNTNSSITDWKILTLKQLRRKNHALSGKQEGKSCDRSRGIYVSISGSKRKEGSKQKQEQKIVLNKKSPYFKNLQMLNKKGQLIDRLQTHMDKRSQRGYLC